MKTSSITLVILATLLLSSTGCVVGRSLGTGLAETVSYRHELAQTKMELKAAEQEARRLEIQNLRRAELNELKKNQVQMVPELQSALSTQFNQQIRGLTIRPNYKAMEKISVAMNKLEEENERVYQDQLADWVKQQTQAQSQQTKLASYRPFCKLHGHGCNCCPQEPDCASPPPPKEPVKAPPERPKLPVVDVPMTVEFSIRQNVEGAEFLFSNPTKAPVKEPCLPKEPCDPCDAEACSEATGSPSGTGLYRIPSNPPIPYHLKTLPVRTDLLEESNEKAPPVPVPVVPIGYTADQTAMSYPVRNPLR